MKVTWEVDDGYLGASGPHVTEIPDEDLEDMSDEVRQLEIEEWVLNDFMQNITYRIIRIEED